MLFIAGVSPRQKMLEFDQTMVCPSCGRYDRYEVFMEYTCLSLFFIPVLKWDRKYYVRSSCCGSLYYIPNGLGMRIAKGEAVTITEQDLQRIEKEQVFYVRHCPNCGFQTHEDFQYCPKCSSKLKGE